MMRRLLILLLLCICNAEHLIHHMLRLRHQNLHRFVTGTHDRPATCSTNTFVLITEFQFGRTGNNLIELTHGLWISEQLNATLVIPQWMQDIFVPFNTSLLQNHYCYITNEKDIPSNAKKYEVTSEDSFFTFKLFRDKTFEALLPPLSDRTMHDLSMHFLRVYASLWCCPHKKILQAVEFIISTHLDGNFAYSSVHKRQLEGGCSKILASNTKPTDFSPRQLPMDHAEWSQSLVHAHPLCEMTYSFVRSTLELNRRNNSKIFVAYDGRGGIEDYKQHDCVFSSVLDDSNAFRAIPYDRKFVDMLMAIHSDFFVLNPRSTFSWQIYLIRLLLSLPSVPVIKNNDFYMQRADEMAASKRDVWVSWTSTLNALMGSDY